MSNWRDLRGRKSECDALTDLLGQIRAGRSQALVLRGEPGIGKTALLDFLIKQAEGFQVVRAAGMESEMELAFAGLHQLCGPFLERLDRLPGPQQDALATTFGLRMGTPPDPFVLGLGALNLMAEASSGTPLLCVVDDAQWIDEASSQALEFVARRLDAERVALIFAVRDNGGQQRLTSLPDLVLGGLNSQDAATLLDRAVTGPLDQRVRDRVVAEAHGNPLALLELPRALSAVDLTFGLASPNPSAPTGSGLHDDARGSLFQRLESGFLHQIAQLEPETRRLLLIAAAEPVGQVALLWRAAEELGLDVGRAMSFDTEGLLTLGHRVEFRHPMIRSAAYRSASDEERRRVHQVLADVTDPDKDPDRRAWHRARATAGTDEAVASELAASADRALARGGIAAAAAFLDAAAARTPDPDTRARRSLAAAQAKITAGSFSDALTLLAGAQAGRLTETEQAQVELMQAQIAHLSQHGNRGLPMLLRAARRFEPLDPKVTREIYLDALAAAMFAGRLAAGPEVGMQQVARAMGGMRWPDELTRTDRLLHGIATLYSDGYAAAAPDLRETLAAFRTDELGVEEAVRFGWLAACVACDIWDDAGWDVLTLKHLEAIRAIGALSVLPVALHSRAIYLLYRGDLAAAAALVSEAAWVAEVTGGSNAMIPYGEVCLYAMRGNASAADPMFLRIFDEIAARGEGVGINMSGWFQAVMYNGSGRYAEALTAAKLGAASPLELGPPKWSLAEAVEAGARSGNLTDANEALEQLTTFAEAAGTNLSLGVLASRRALVQTGQVAESGYQESIERLSATTMRVELARAQLRYGEWLRREGRRVDARGQLRAAYEAFASMGVDAFTERTGRELAATGETVRQRTPEATKELTAQEAHIARLAADGLTNPEIGAVLFISPRTVEWHLRKVYSKLGVTTRRQLKAAIPDVLNAALMG